MNLREFIVKEYQACVRNSPAVPPELKEALRVNERVPGFIDNLAREFSNPFFKNYTNNALRVIIQDATQMFLNLLNQKAYEKSLSESAVLQIKRDMADKQIIEKACDTGVIDEEVIDVLKRQSEKE